MKHSSLFLRMAVVIFLFPFCVYAENFVVKKVRQVTVSEHDKCMESAGKLCDALADLTAQAGKMLEAVGKTQGQMLQNLAQELQCGNAAVFHQADALLKEFDKQAQGAVKKVNSVTTEVKKVAQELENLSKKLVEKK